MGKLLLSKKKKRESAFLQWHVQQTKEKQQLDLNTYLGINVLHLESNKNIHTIKVDGKTYHGENIESLIFSITGLTLPAQALTYWLKGLPYTPDDEIIFDDNTQLPKTLTSQYNNVTWQLSFDDYQQIDVYILAKKITIKQNNLLIKIAINQWTF